MLTWGQASRDNVPRYLFRAFGKGSGSGGKELNSEQDVIPRAFVYGNGHRHIREIPNLEYMLKRHLTTKKIETEFRITCSSVIIC